MSGHIVVVGSLNMDIVCEVARAPEAGETLLGKTISFVAGGKGANQAVACARLGLAGTSASASTGTKRASGAVRIIGRVGADAFGERLRAGLVQDGIDVTQVGVDASAGSGVALIQVDEEGQNRITVVPGANATLTPEHVSAARSSFAGAAMLLLQLETPLPTVARAIEEARRAAVPVLLNPAPAQRLPDAWWRCIDFLVPNESEASLLSGVPVRNDDSALAAAKLLKGLGAKHVLVTLGARGVLILDDAGGRFIDAPRVAVMDTTAAGDTFVGALAAMLAEGQPLDAAAQFAVRAASLSVTRAGAQTSIPRRAELLP